MALGLTDTPATPLDEATQAPAPALRPKYPFPVWVEEVQKAHPDLNRADATQLYLDRYGPPPEEEMPDQASYGATLRETNPGLDEVDTHALYNQTVGLARKAAGTKETEGSDFLRGFKEALKQQPELAHGVSALAAATGENIFGSGGAMTSWKQSALESYQNWAKEVASTSQPNDSFSHAWEQASQNGNPGALVDFVQRSLGYVTGQVGVVLSVGALASLAGGPVSGVTAALATAGSGGAAKTGVRAAISKAVEGLIEREGAKLVGKGLAADELKRQATINASKYLAARAALAPYETFMEAGEIGGESVLKATEEGRNLSGGELARVLGASVLAGTIGAAEDIYGLKALRGSTKVNKILDTAPGLMGKAARAGAQGTVLGAAGAATEGLQTAVEQVGMGQDPTTEASVREQVDAMAVGAVGGGAVGGLGGAVQSPDSVAAQAGIPPNSATAGGPSPGPTTPGEQARQRLQLEVEKMRALSKRTKDEAQSADLETKAITGEVGVFDPAVSLDQAIAKAEASGESFNVHDILTEAMVDQALDPEYQQTLALEDMRAQEAQAAEEAPAQEQGIPQVDLPVTSNSLGAFEGQLTEQQTGKEIAKPARTEEELQSRIDAIEDGLENEWEKKYGDSGVEPPVRFSRNKELDQLYREREEIYKKQKADFIEKTVRESGVSPEEAKAALKSIELIDDQFPAIFGGRLRRFDAESTDNLGRIYNSFAEKKYPGVGDQLATFSIGGTADKPTMVGRKGDRQPLDPELLKKTESVFNAIAKNAGHDPISLAKPQRTPAETDIYSAIEDTEKALDAKGPQPQVPEAEAFERTDRYEKFFERLGRKMAMESEGQNVLYDMEEQGITPTQVADEFWKETYPNLPPKVQRKYMRMVEERGGPTLDYVDRQGKRGSYSLLANDIPASEYFDLPDDVNDLEGTDRGFVALMREGNKRFGKVPNAQEVAPAQVAEVKAAAPIAPVKPLPLTSKERAAEERAKLLAKKAARTIQDPTPTDLVKEPRSALPDEQNAEILSRASKAQADLEVGAEAAPSLIEFLRSKGGVKDPGGDLRQLEIDRENKPFTNRLVKDSGMNLDDAAEVAFESGFIKERNINLLLDKLDEESRGIGESQPDWYKQVTTGRRKLTAAQVEQALAKIVRDKGEDVGRPVEIVKDAILQDEDFATSHYAPRSERDAQMVQEFVRKEREGIAGKTQTFKTAKGSSYTVHPDGTTTRNKAARPEHPGEQGIQPRSERTVYVTPEDAVALGEVQAKGGPKTKLGLTKDGRIGVQYLEGKDKGKFEGRTVKAFKEKPEVGLMPIELIEGKTAHFGNAITEVQDEAIERQADDQDFRLTPVSQRKAKAAPQANEELFGTGEVLQTGVSPIIGREATMEEAPLFSKTAQEADIEQESMFGKGEQVETPITPYPAKLDKVSVKVPTEDGTGAMVDANARHALEQLDTEKAQLERLKNCLKK